MNKIIALLGVAVVLVGGFLLMKTGQGGTLLDSVGNAVSPVGNTTENKVSVKEFTVEGSSFAFAPKTMTVNKGDTVKITFINKVGFHDFVIDEFVGAKTKQIKAGENEVITFVADKSGTFEYYCSVGTHRQQGMVGSLTVI
ncbi:MAG TPA: cupredoxin domain-containing protein [Parcubacteria group bacterium]|nr:cupredoxin domain-containing protein [Parcubacteria group bacterium]